MNRHDDQPGFGSPGQAGARPREPKPTRRNAPVSLGALACIALLLAGCRAPTSQQAVNDPTQVPWSGRQGISAVVSHVGDRAVVSWVADQLPNRQISLLDLATLSEEKLDPTNQELGPGGTWSPGDRHFATVAHTGRWAVGIVDAATFTWRPVPPPAFDSKSSVYTSTPRWSPDGGRLLFDAVAEDQNGRSRHIVCLYGLGADSSIPLTDGYIRHSDNPFWGEWFVLSRSTAELDARGELRRRVFVAELNPRSGRARREHELLPDRVVDHVSVSADGTRAFALCLPDSSSAEPDSTLRPCVIYLLTGPPDATQAHLLTDTLLASDYDVTWSNHGDHIAARLWEQGDELSTPLCVVDAASGEVTLLRDREGRLIRGQGPQWVDDDRRLAYWLSGQDLRGEVWCYVFGTKENYRLLPPPE